MNVEIQGEIYSLLAAVTWACALILFKLSGERISAISLNLFKNVVGLVFLFITLLVSGESIDTLSSFETEDYLILIISGFLGIALADTALFYALQKIGVGFVTVVECLYSPAVILLAAWFLAETLSPFQYVGVGLVVTAVLISSKHHPPLGRTRRDVIRGFAAGASAMLLMAIGIVLAKPVLEGQGFPLIAATTLRMIAGTLALSALALASPKRREIWSVFRPTAVWKVSIPASFLGTYLAMIFWVAGFKYARASIAAILNQTSMIFALILATIILKEPFTRRKLSAVILAAAGVLIVTFGKQ